MPEPAADPESLPAGFEPVENTLDKHIEETMHAEDSSGPEIYTESPTTLGPILEGIPMPRTKHLNLVRVRLGPTTICFPNLKGLLTRQTDFKLDKSGNF